MEIKSVSNAKVKTWMKYHSKKHRDIEHKFLIEGEHLIQEALKSECIETILVRLGVSHSFSHPQIVYVSDEVIQKLSKNISLVDCIAVCHKIKYATLPQSRVVLLDDVQDPGNVGTIIRTAHSFGFDTVYLSKASADLYNEKTIRSTQGAFFHMRVETVDIEEKIVELQQNDFKVCATALKNAVGLSTIQQVNNIAFVFGNEGLGVKSNIMDMCDERVFVEMSHFESLNVGIAAGICMYSFRK